MAVRPAGCRLRLRAGIDPQGRSVRPEQVLQWLQERLGVPLRLGAVSRDALVLRSAGEKPPE
jgi:hypothetical protein